MAFQTTVAGSYDVDIVYGPQDKIRPLVIHWEAAGRASLHIKVVNEQEEVVAKKSYQDIQLPDGRTSISLDDWQPEVNQEGHFAIEYELQIY